ncbi:hypothetical protein [Curtobacterium sp. TXMA1]|uniref:hypothetical protein n=1 Tax=Curtobacterium sp. TXMA1 TaxID=2876939 RepID=UPI001CCB7D88|nr:hypothetical protein [Curtobacterium sp. TXMA1]UBQ03663.1 hypothetical protein LCG91_05755 [Curtobacterium sp. TXMA1]
MSNGEPKLPWPDVRWDRLAIVGGLVLEVPDGWTAVARSGAVELVRAGSTITLRAVDTLGADPALEFAAVAAEDPDALLVEGVPDRLVVLGSSDTFQDVRYAEVGLTAVRITARGRVREWPAVTQVVDGVLRSRWSSPSSRRTAGDSETARDTGVGISVSASSGPTAAKVRDRAAAPFTVRGPNGLFEHLVQVEDRGIVPGRLRRSEVGSAARAAGLTGRFGALTAAGAALLRPAHGPDDLLVVECRTRDVVSRRWRAWLRDGDALVVEDGDGGSTMGVLPDGQLVRELLAWLDVDPTWAVAGAEPVSVPLAGLDDREGPCPSNVRWMQAAWRVRDWQTVRGWGERRQYGVLSIVVPGIGVFDREVGGGRLTMRPSSPAELARDVVRFLTTERRDQP